MTDNIIIFPNSHTKITPEEYSMLNLHIVENGDTVGLYIEGFACQADVQSFIEMLDARFLKIET